jgi:hypothetical protein
LKSTFEVWQILQAWCLHMLFPKFAMLHWLIRNLKFLQIQVVKVLGTEHGGLYHLKDVHFSEGLIRVFHHLV